MAETYSSLLKRGWSLNRCRSLEIPTAEIIRCISEDKKKDVLNLLNIMFGEEWKKRENLLWYKQILSLPSLEENISFYCDCAEDDSGLHI